MAKGGGSTQVQTSEPWAAQQPFLRDIYNQAQQLFRQGPQEYFPGSTVAGFSPETQTALGAIWNRAMGGAPHEQALSDFVMGQLGQPGVDISPAIAGANMLIGGIGAGQNALGQFAANPFNASVFGMPGAGQFADVLSAGFGGLDQAQQFAGSPMLGSLGASNALVQSLMQNPTNALMAGGGFADTLAAAQNFGGLSGAQEFAGTPTPGALDASVNYVNNLLGSQGSLIPDAARQQLEQTASGEFLGSNPFLDDLFNTAASRVTEQFQQSVLPGINATFGGAGRTGSGIHGEVVSQAAGELGQNLSGLAANIFAPAFESERGRQMQAAAQLGGLGLDEAQQRLQAAGLGGDLFATQNAADLARLGLASDLFLGQQGQALQAAGMGLGAVESGLQRQLQAAGLGGDLFSAANAADLARRGLAADLYLGERGLAQQGAGMGLDFLGAGLDRSLQAASILGQQGLGGIGALGSLFGQQGAMQQGAAGLIPALSGMDFRNLQAALGVGSALDQLAQAQLSDEVARHNFEQNAPLMNLQNYANLIYGSPSFGTTTMTQQTSSNPLAGLLGGGLAGLGAAGSLFGSAGAGPMAALGLTNPIGWGLMGGGALLGLLS